MKLLSKLEFERSDNLLKRYGSVLNGIKKIYKMVFNRNSCGFACNCYRSTALFWNEFRTLFR